MDLFRQTDKSSEPLASRMRPRTLDEFAGQDHIVGPGRLLRRAIQADMLSSVIFYGPPGTGKTTLARIIAGTTKSAFLSLNATLSGKKDLKESIEKAQEHRDVYSRKTILFVDEVHRWNKAQQDTLLPWLENGTIILIGATTENPFFEVNSALVSRSRLFQLKALTSKDLKKIVLMALADKKRGYGRWKVHMAQEVLNHLVKVSEGDARTLLNALQLAVETSYENFPPPDGTDIDIDRETAEESIQKKAVLYDKEGDYHFDTISAFIKSIRGSDPDAALYWMARMVHAGEDPRYILRRLLISAAEDIGLADPQALGVVNAAAQAFDRIGLPEGQFLLTQAALYLANAPKSNSTLAYFDALKAVKEEHNKEVPNHLRDTGRDAHGFNHGEGYQYPHAFRDHWVAQNYLPDNLRGRFFYTPGDLGWEGEHKETIYRRREAQLAIPLENSAENLSFSQGDKRKNNWLARLSNPDSRNLTERLTFLTEHIRFRRHERVLIASEPSPLLLWTALRACPEGSVTAVLDHEEARQRADEYARVLPELEKPYILAQLPEPGSETGHPYEKILWRQVGSEKLLQPIFWENLRQLAAENSLMTGIEPVSAGFQISQTPVMETLPEKLKNKILEFDRKEDKLFSADLWLETASEYWKPEEQDTITQSFTLLMTNERVETLLNSCDKNSLYSRYSETMNKEEKELFGHKIKKDFTDKNITWKRRYLRCGFITD